MNLLIAAYLATIGVLVIAGTGWTFAEALRLLGGLR